MEAPADLKARTVPLIRISPKGQVHQSIGRLWHAFALRIKQARAHSVMSWPEWEALEDELGAVGNVGVVIQDVVTLQGTANVNKSDIGENDPVGTIEAEVWKEVPNRCMRLVRLTGQEENGPDLVCWVPRHKIPSVGQKIWMCPNEDERGGYVMAGEYGRQGGRIR